MKKQLFLFVLFATLFSFQTTILADEPTSSGETSVYDSINNGGEPSPPASKEVADSKPPTLFPLFFKFIVSSALVIGLLVFLLRFLSKRNRLLPSSGPVLPLGGQVLGNNRSIQVVLIGQTIYVIGVGETVSLIRTISQGEEYQHLLEGYENQADTLSPTWLPKDTKDKFNAVFQKYVQKMQKENKEE
ncbi:MAG: flagellar biosis protein [Neobacillus sp.]|jgi:flagellar protein FliO/FliZ|nr:flagellar biosis protein [Neobacillus sp.]